MGILKKKLLSILLTAKTKTRVKKLEESATKNSFH